MRLFVSLFFLFNITIGFSQSETKPVVDSLFREDQFYVSIAYNFIQKKPDNFNQYSFSTGLSAGFLRDFPISENRHWAIAPGIGYSYNDLKQTIDLSSVTGNPDFELVKSRIILHYVDLPLEIRWRNATPDSHKFWRIHAGFMASYLLDGSFQYDGDLGSGKENIKDVFDCYELDAETKFSFIKGENTFLKAKVAGRRNARDIKEIHNFFNQFKDQICSEYISQPIGIAPEWINHISRNYLN